MEGIFTQLGEFITSMFTALTSVITQASGNVIGIWLIIVPIFGLVMAWASRLLNSGIGKKRRR